MISTSPCFAEPISAKTAGSGVKFVVPSESVPEAVAARDTRSKRILSLEPGCELWKRSFVRKVGPMLVQLMWTSMEIVVPEMFSKTSTVAFSVAVSSWLSI